MIEDLLFVINILAITITLQFTIAFISGNLGSYQTRINVINKNLVWRQIRYTLIYYTISYFISTLDSKNILNKIIFVYTTPVKVSTFFFTSYTLLLTIFLSITYLIFHNRIRRSLLQDAYRNLSKLRGYKQYIFSSILLNITMLVFMTLIYFLYEKIINWFSINGMSLFDWLNSDNSPNENFKNGIFFSVILAAIFSTVYFNAIIKYSEKYEREQFKYKFFPFGLMLFFTSLAGFYSVTNSISNILSAGDPMLWYKKDNQIGFYSLRTASLILLYHVVSFFQKYVVKENFFKTLYAGISKNYHIYVRKYALSDYEFSTTFIAQISFYVLNVFVAELSWIFQESSLLRGIIRYGLVVIVDDYVIIHTYAINFNKMLKNHSRIITLFNGLLLIGSTLTLISIKQYEILSIYLLLTAILAVYYYQNRANIEIVKPQRVSNF